MSAIRCPSCQWSWFIWEAIHLRSLQVRQTIARAHSPQTLAGPAHHYLAAHPGLVNQKTHKGAQGAACKTIDDNGEHQKLDIHNDNDCRYLSRHCQVCIAYTYGRAAIYYSRSKESLPPSARTPCRSSTENVAITTTDSPTRTKLKPRDPLESCGRARLCLDCRVGRA